MAHREGHAVNFFLRKQGSTAISYLAETTAWAAACTTPPTTGRKNLTNTTIGNLMDAGIWATLDWLMLPASETEQAGRVNVRVPAKVAINVNSTTFTADRGFTGDAISMHISLGEDIDTGGNYTLNSGAAGVWCNQQNGLTGVFYHLGTSGKLFINARANGGNETFEINDATASVLQGNTGSRLGHRAVARTAAGVKRGYYGGARVADLTTASTAIPGSNAWLLRFSSTYGVDRIGAFYSGAGMDDTQMADMDTILNTHLTAIGGA